MIQNQMICCRFLCIWSANYNPIPGLT